MWRIPRKAAFRVISTEEARDLACQYAPEISEKYKQQLEAYKRMPDSVLFRVQKVKIPYLEYDLPGPSKKKAVCVKCGQVVRDSKEVAINNKSYCRPCAQGAYFEDPVEIDLSEIQALPEHN